MKYEYVIGLEIHIKLNSPNKMFCRCPNVQEFDDLSANTNICPVCTGQPGALPVLNQEPLDKAILLGLSLDCEISQNSQFDRKSYFYPDLPLGFQITQFQIPTNNIGKVGFYLNNYQDKKQVRILKAHLENDAGKTIHESGRGVLDYNRAGTPLVEIVTHPDFTNDEEVIEFLKELQRRVRFNNIGNADLEKGQMRCDVNLSTRLVGTQELGTKVEIKNLNSYSAIKRAINHEFARQIELLSAGQTIDQETRGWDDQIKNSYTMRSKEDALDYRYFPEPDLPLLQINQEYIQNIKKQLVSSPYQRIKKYLEEYKFNKEFINALISNKEVNFYFENIVATGIDPKIASKWIVNYILRNLNDINNTNTEINIANLKFSPAQFIHFLKLIVEGKLIEAQAKQVITEMLETGKDPDLIIKDKGFTGINNDQLEQIIQSVCEENPNAVADLKNGQNKAIGFLIGQVMSKSGGKANPKDIKGLLEKLYKE